MTPIRGAIAEDIKATILSESLLLPCGHGASDSVVEEGL